MISLDYLSCLDGLIWLRTQENVARKMGLAQSSVSRNARRCCRVFGVSLVKVGAEYHLSGDLTLINMQRDVHQYHEWNTTKALRIDGQCDVHQCLCRDDNADWLYGNFDYDSPDHSLRLLRQGIVDVWISQETQIPPEHDSALASVALLPHRRPEHLLVRRRYLDHPRFLHLRETLSSVLDRALRGAGTGCRRRLDTAAGEPYDQS
jgi:hypothetical protein